jgi:hypothetical protein
MCLPMLFSLFGPHGTNTYVHIYTTHTHSYELVQHTQLYLYVHQKIEPTSH